MEHKALHRSLYHKLQMTSVYIKVLVTTSILTFITNSVQRLLWQSSGENPRLPRQEAWVRSLVGELRSHTSHPKNKQTHRHTQTETHTHTHTHTHTLYGEKLKVFVTLWVCDITWYTSLQSWESFHTIVMFYKFKLLVTFSINFLYLK